VQRNRYQYTDFSKKRRIAPNVSVNYSLSLRHYETYPAD
jgi:hypothetical protein